jgi:hypothetical protein
VEQVSPPACPHPASMTFMAGFPSSFLLSFPAARQQWARWICDLRPSRAPMSPQRREAPYASSPARRSCFSLCNGV